MAHLNDNTNYDLHFQKEREKIFFSWLSSAADNVNFFIYTVCISVSLSLSLSPRRFIVITKVKSVNRCIGEACELHRQNPVENCKHKNTIFHVYFYIMLCTLSARVLSLFQCMIIRIEVLSVLPLLLCEKASF